MTHKSTNSKAVWEMPDEKHRCSEQGGHRVGADGTQGRGGRAEPEHLLLALEIETPVGEAGLWEEEVLS